MEGKRETEEELHRVCEEQRLKIENLETKLREKESEVVSLNSVLRQYSSKEQLSRLNPLFAVAAPAKQLHVPIPGADFWDNHLEGNEGNDYSFEDIAAKGLWILSSATERPALGSQTLRKPLESQPSAVHRRKPTPYHPAPPAKSSPVQERGSRAVLDTVRLPTLRLPQIQSGKSGKVVFKSTSPVKVQAIESKRLQEPGYPISQAQLRSKLQPSLGLPHRGYAMSPIKRANAPLKSRKASYDPNFRVVEDTLALRKAKKAVNVSPKGRPGEVQSNYSHSPQRPKPLDPIRKSVSLITKKPQRRP